MTERDGYQPGVPCWVDTWQPDAEAAVGFYTTLFGWEAEETTPRGSARRHFMCRLRGRDVAAVGGPQPLAGAPAWTSYVWVGNADDTVATVTGAGGSVVVAPFASLDGGRMAIVADPEGAVFGLWQPGEHRGAQLVNEPGAWAMSQLSTPDPEGAKAFYGAALGWEAETLGEITLWRLPGYVGGKPEQPVPRDVVGVMTRSDDAPAQWGVDFWVGDTDATANTATELGGTVVVPPFDTPFSRNAVLADPHGAMFSVSKVSVTAPG
jgi:predicted enzyme related to lactoylglutathione lyase